MSWTRGLNPEQITAVQHNHGPMLILAGAGSGKTTVLVARTGRLISELVARPDQILVLTFTNKAAKELKHRVSKKIGKAADKIWAGTFHSFGLSLLKKYFEEAGLPRQFGIVDSTDCHSILRELMREVKITGKDKFDPDRLLNLINDIRVYGIKKFENAARDEYHDLAEMLAPKFVKRLSALGVVDFEGLLLKPLELFKKHPEILEKLQEQFTQVMVDEFQDTNGLQMELVMALGRHQNLTVVGDDDQSIYGWRGAEVQNILQFPKLFKTCEVVKLERNYRSSSLILDFANEVISKNTSRHGKTLKPESRPNKEVLPEMFVLENEDEECEFAVNEIRYFQSQGYALRDIAILYRSNTQGALIESSLRRHQIHYEISGGSSIFERKEVKDLMAYLKLAIKPDELSLKRILNTPSRGIGETSFERLIEYTKIHKTTFFQACRHSVEAGVPEKATESITALLHFLSQLKVKIFADGGTPGARFVSLMAELGYREYVFATSADGHAGEKKWQLVEVFGRILDNFLSKRSYDEATLKDFIEMMVLRDSDDDDIEKDAVSLMTLHASKGLEFPVVLLIGLEEDVLPHRSLGGNLDEERRLLYVGITRAKERLVMSRCQQRKRHGAMRPSAPSRFLLDLRQGLYSESTGAFRPVTQNQREEMVSGLLASLQARREKEVKQR